MTDGPRIVLDTNVVISAVLWRGRPGELLDLAGDGSVRLYTSAGLLTELRATLAKSKLARAVAATGLGIEDISARYRRLATIVRPIGLAEPASRDRDDDKVLACAISAKADFVVSGDEDLLVLGDYADIRIVSVVEALGNLGTKA